MQSEILTMSYFTFQQAASGDAPHFESTGGRQGTNPAADYSEGASHVLDVIHRILNHHRALEQKWHVKKIKLHQRLALRLFQEDVKQVCFDILYHWLF